MNAIAQDVVERWASRFGLQYDRGAFVYNDSLADFDELLENAFCPTGKGGGIKATCGTGVGGSKQTAPAKGMIGKALGAVGDKAKGLVKGGVSKLKTAVGSGADKAKKKIVQAGTKVNELYGAGTAKLLGVAKKQVYDRLPKSAQKLVDMGKHLEHKLEKSYANGQAIAKEMARGKGLNDAQVNRVSRALSVADGVGRWTANIPAAHAAIHSLAHIGGPVAFLGAKVGWYVPAASLGYIGYSMAGAALRGKNPLKMVNEARKRVRAAGAAIHNAVQLVFNAASPEWAEAVADWLAPLDDDQADWAEALLAAALDETGGDKDQALATATMQFEEDEDVDAFASADLETEEIAGPEPGEEPPDLEPSTGLPKEKKTQNALTLNADSHEGRIARIVNAFCPTGKGGGVKATCGKGGAQKPGGEDKYHVKPIQGPKLSPQLQAAKDASKKVKTKKTKPEKPTEKKLDAYDQYLADKAKETPMPKSKPTVKSKPASVPKSKPLEQKSADGSMKTGDRVKHDGKEKTIEQIKPVGAGVMAVKFKNEPPKLMKADELKPVAGKTPRATDASSTKPAAPTPSMSVIKTPSKAWDKAEKKADTAKDKPTSKTIDKDHHAIVNTHAKEVIPTLSVAAKHDIQHYCSSGYQALNKAMRGCPPPPFPCLQGGQKQSYENIQGALDKAPPFAKPVKVNRGMTISDPNVLKNVVANLQKAKDVGVDDFQLPSFTSTSLAKGFGGNITFKITAKKGLYVKSLSNYKKEEEVLLSPHSKFKVKEVVQKGKRHVVHLEES